MEDFSKLYEVLKKYGEETTMLMAKALADTINIKKNIKFTIDQDQEIKGVFRIPSYGVFIDAGRKANSKMPPIKVIENWIKDKGIAPFKDYKDNNIPLTTQAFLIARSIGRKGIKPRPFLYIIEKTLKAYKNEFEIATSKDIANILQTNFDDAGIGA